MSISQCLQEKVQVSWWLFFLTQCLAWCFKYTRFWIYSIKTLKLNFLRNLYPFQTPLLFFNYFFHIIIILFPAKSLSSFLSPSLFDFFKLILTTSYQSILEYGTINHYSNENHSDNETPVLFFPGQGSRNQPGQWSDLSRVTQWVGIKPEIRSQCPESYLCCSFNSVIPYILSPLSSTGIPSSLHSHHLWQDF